MSEEGRRQRKRRRVRELEIIVKSEGIVREEKLVECQRS